MYSAQERTRHIWIIIVLIVLNIGLVRIFGGDAKNLMGEHVDSNSGQMIRAILITMLISIPIIGFIIGGLVALIPYKGLKYKNKYLRASLLTIITINIIIFATRLIGFFA
ncbi:hypothetical protein [Rufibacter roseus]|uniref:DUF1634 domain-containing protein n=1 Tax=Rufibacter roseus TaxID=1567108 RepID=A0ABW2DNL2_9BACT|nr:hypothetical protein [Rufibacter roseus]